MKFHLRRALSTRRLPCCRGSLAVHIDAFAASASMIGEGYAPYTQADRQLKESALAKTAPTKAILRRYRPTDQVLAFLNGL